MNKSLWFLKRRFLVLVLSFLLPLIPLTTTYAFGLENENEYEYSKKLCDLVDAYSLVKAIDNHAKSLFISKCYDKTAKIKDVKKAHKKYKEAFRKRIKIGEQIDRDFFKSIKDGSKSIKDVNGKLKKYNEMPASWQAETQAFFEDYLKARDNLFCTQINVIDAEYNLAKVDRIYYKVKKPEVVAKKIEEAKKRLDEESEKLNIAQEKNLTAYYAFANRAFAPNYQQLDEKFKHELKKEKERRIIELSRISRIKEKIF
jgi:hypothetical protein